MESSEKYSRLIILDVSVKFYVLALYEVKHLLTFISEMPCLRATTR